MYTAIRISPEYECSPIWVSKDGVTYSNFDLSYFEDTLKGALFQWDQQFQNTFNRADPPSSCFCNKREHTLFELEGLLFWHILLGQNKNTTISYWSSLFEREFFDINEFEQKLLSIISRI